MNLDAYGFRLLQAFAVLIEAAAAESMDMARLRGEIDEHLRKSRMGLRREMPAATRRGRAGGSRHSGWARCPVCGARAIVERVNVCPSTNVGGKWRSAITCTASECMHAELSELAVSEAVTAWH